MNKRIEIKPQVCHGKPVIKGTRVMVASILAALGSGDTIDQLLEDYTNITREDVLAALEFGGQLSRFEEAAYELPT